jgi:hypothetical protein
MMAQFGVCTDGVDGVAAAAMAMTDDDDDDDDDEGTDGNNTNGPPRETSSKNRKYDKFWDSRTDDAGEGRFLQCTEYLERGILGGRNGFYGLVVVVRKDGT